MTNKKTCGAILCASALIVVVMFILGSGCGGGGGSDDLTTPPRETFFTPIYHPSNGGTFANPKDIGLGDFFRFLYQDDDQDGVSGQDDNLFWGGTQSWTDVDQMGEGRVVLRKHDNLDQYVVALYHTNPSPLPMVTPTPWRYHSWNTTRIFEAWQPIANRGPFAKSLVESSLAAPGVTVQGGGTGRHEVIPPMITQYGLEDRYESAKRSAAVDNYLRNVSSWQTNPGWPDRATIGQLAGLYEKPEQPSLIPTPSPLPTPDLARNVDTSSLSEGDIVYFTTLSPFDPFVEAEVLAISPNSIIFGDTAFPDWAEPEIEDNVDWLQEQFDERISPRLRLFFGDSDAATYDYIGPDPDDMDLVETGVGDIDADGRVSILLTPVALDIGGGGFFYAGDLIAFDEFLFPITNEMNVIYVTVFDDDLGFTKELIAEILSHEYLHLIHFIEKTYKRIINIFGDEITIQEYISALQSPDINEMEGWVTEGFGMLAEDLAGYATTDLFSPAGRAWIYLSQTAGTSLTDNSHMPWVDGMGYLWFRYLMEQSGGIRFATTWEDDLLTDSDYVAERIGVSEKGIDLLRAIVGRKEIGLEVVEEAFVDFDARGGRDFPETFADFTAMLLLDNAKAPDATPFNTNPKYNLDRNAVWPGGIDLTTGFESGMRTHENRIFSLFPGFAILAEIELVLWEFDTASLFEGTTDAGVGGGWELGNSSPDVWYILFRPFRDYAFTGEYGSQYDSMEFFFAGDMPWDPRYLRFKSGVSIFRVTGLDGFWVLGVDTEPL